MKPVDLVRLGFHDKSHLTTPRRGRCRRHRCRRRRRRQHRCPWGYSSFFLFLRFWFAHRLDDLWPDFLRVYPIFFDGLLKGSGTKFSSLKCEADCHRFDFRARLLVFFWIPKYIVFIFCRCEIESWSLDDASAALKDRRRHGRSHFCRQVEDTSYV